MGLSCRDGDLEGLSENHGGVSGQVISGGEAIIDRCPCFFVSEDGRYAAWMDGMDPYGTTSITFMDFDTGKQTKVQADQGTRIRLFGFINSDLIYGVANEEDIVSNASGGTDFAMNEVRIQDFQGDVVKSYHQDGYYILDVTIQENLLELSRATDSEEPVS